MNWKNKIKVLPQYLIPQHWCSRLLGKFANCRWKWLKNWMIATFIKKYQIDISEAEPNDPFSYDTFNLFFIRALAKNIRPIASNPDAIISPVDGMVSQFGDINDRTLIQAKGFDFDLVSLLGGDSHVAEPFRHGKFATLYLSPKDYHRVHMPLCGELTQMIYIPGRLFSVNLLTSQTIPQLFSRNERVVCLFQTEVGPMALILVGATFVASIATTWAGIVTPHSPRSIERWHYPLVANEAITLERGEEMGHFQFGSTAILLFGHDVMDWSSQLKVGSPLKMGEMLGNFCKAGIY